MTEISEPETDETTSLVASPPAAPPHDNDDDWRTRTAAALQRRRLFLEARREARRVQVARTRELEIQRRRREDKAENRLQRGLASVGNALQKVNIGRWIDDLERDQELADDLDRVNAENAAEADRLEICRQAEEACRKAMEEHLASFLREHPDDGSYEDWIRELHPDNVAEDDDDVIDARLLAPDCDHRLMWDEMHAVHDRQRRQQSGQHHEDEDLVEEDLSSGATEDRDGDAKEAGSA